MGLALQAGIAAAKDPEAPRRWYLRRKGRVWQKVFACWMENLPAMYPLGSDPAELRQFFIDFRNLGETGAWQAAATRAWELSGRTSMYPDQCLQVFELDEQQWVELLGAQDPWLVAQRMQERRNKTQ